MLHVYLNSVVLITIEPDSFKSSLTVNFNNLTLNNIPSYLPMIRCDNKYYPGNNLKACLFK